MWWIETHKNNKRHTVYVFVCQPLPKFILSPKQMRTQRHIIIIYYIQIHTHSEEARPFETVIRNDSYLRFKYVSNYSRTWIISANRMLSVISLRELAYSEAYLFCFWKLRHKYEDEWEARWFGYLVLKRFSTKSIFLYEMSMAKAHGFHVNRKPMFST